LTLFGHLKFDASALPVNRLEAAMKEIIDPLVASVREYYDRVEIDLPEVEPDEVIDRTVLEQAVLRAQLSEDERLAPHADRLARLALDLKEHALRDGDGDHLVRVLRGGLGDLSLAPPTPPPPAEPSVPQLSLEAKSSLDPRAEPVDGSGDGTGSGVDVEVDDGPGAETGAGGVPRRGSDAGAPADATAVPAEVSP
jgi:hypothetical protein